MEFKEITGKKYILLMKILELYSRWEKNAAPGWITLLKIVLLHIVFSFPLLHNLFHQKNKS